MRDKIPTEVIEVLTTLENAGFEAYLVGGCVRDLHLDKEPKDWDATTNATPEEIQKIFEDSFYENDFGTVGIKTRSENPKTEVVEVTPYRLESKYSDNRHPDSVSFSKNIEDDLKRRDFTINALAMSKDGEVVDNFGGLKDLEDKTIKAVGDPDERFQEDALRILRAIRFSAELEFTIDSLTLTAIEKNKDLLKNVSHERIREEFVKIIMSDNPMIGLGMAQKMSILGHILPELDTSVGVSQNKEAHKFDVFEHLLRSLQHSADKGFSLEVRLAALFHDISKPETKRVAKNGATTFFGHEVVGARVTRKALQRLTFSKEVVDKVTKLVRWHMFFSDPDEITMTAVRRMIARVGEDSIWDLMDLRKCDRIGTGRPKEQPFRFRKYQSMIEEALRDPVSLKMLKMNGDILIKDFDLKPGKHIGHILYALFDEVLEDPTKNNLDYLSKRVEELLKLDEKELEKLGEEGKNKLEEEDEKEVAEIRGKYKVT